MNLATIAVPSGFVARGRITPGPRVAQTRPLGTAPVSTDLFLMFVIATGVHALVGTGVVLRGGLIASLLQASLFAALANNLPAAAALATTGRLATWNAIYAMVIGPNLLVTGSVATVICRRAAMERELTFDWKRLTVLGAALLPMEFVLANLAFIVTSAG